MNKFLLFNIAIFILSSCVNKKLITTVEQNNKSDTIYKQIALKRYGNKVEFLYNKNKDYVLCKKRIDKNNLNPNVLLDFFVYNIIAHEIVYEDKIPNGQIEWLDNLHLIIRQQKGIINSTTDKGYIEYRYNIVSGRKQTIRNEKNHP